jgi:hypothetical protein
MSRVAMRTCLIPAGAIATLALAAYLTGAAAQPASNVPNLQSGPGGWQHPFGGEFPPVPGSALPVRQDPNQPFVTPQQNWRIGDLTNPNLKQWAKDLMKKDNDDILYHGKIQFTANSSCLPAGVPVFDLLPGPHFVVQTPTEVIFMEEQGQQVRHIYLDVPHSANVKPSWYGESVGRYKGGDLIVDTIGVSTKTVLDSYRTPHTDKLHIVERWHLIDGGNGLEVNITVEDPDTFVKAWQTYQRYQRSDRPLGEFICQENNTNLFDYHMPVAEKTDF